MLCLGGGPNPRRFQQSSKFIFTKYISYAAQRKYLNDVAIEDEILPTVGEINNLLLYLNSSNVAMDSAHNKNVSEGHTHNVENRTIKTVPKSNEKETQRLIQRLVPYSQSFMHFT